GGDQGERIQNPQLILRIADRFLQLPVRFAVLSVEGEKEHRLLRSSKDFLIGAPGGKDRSLEHFHAALYPALCSRVAVARTGLIGAGRGPRQILPLKPERN